MDEYIFIDKTLIELAYDYLCMKSKLNNESFTVVDLFLVCEQILKKLELINRKDKQIIRFVSGGVKVKRKWLKEYRSIIYRKKYYKARRINKK